MPKGNQLIENNKRNRKENMKLKKNKGNNFNCTNNNSYFVINSTWNKFRNCT